VVSAGLVRKRIFFSQVLRELLSPRELRAVLRHEAAHCHHHHNFARLLWTLAPHILPASALEASFREVIEYAADDAASAAPGDALNLASAVVVLARRSITVPAVLYSSFIEGDTAVLARRVERLIAPRPLDKPRLVPGLTVCSGVLLALTTVLASHPVAQHVFRESLEQLVH
jgi:Zn-dependent protease with chaperone function